jgi:hypothetical protein
MFVVVSSFFLNESKIKIQRSMIEVPRGGGGWLADFGFLRPEPILDITPRSHSLFF